ncbi:MAG: MBOAT family O-acyltransferase [Clostridia bacterium]|nr:MBOAT family O-acyltransferase [Clostridia bacterium]
MLFNSLSFLIFFPIVLLGYFWIPKRFKQLFLLAASYYFYMCWNPKYALLMLFSTFVTYLCARLLEKTKYKRLFLAGSFVLNLAVLIMFKYYGFFLETANAVLSQFNIALIENNFDVLLPVGISFYTFQALGYTMDVYRGNIAPEKNFIRYALFVSFFPQLVAGPIERSYKLLGQLNDIPNRAVFNFGNFKHGLLLMLWGFFQKLLIADRVAILVNDVYNNLSEHSGLFIAMATVLFAVQIYCDFASYSDIARGAAKIMNIDLMRNFNSPYFARSISEFWRRWHISLSTWFRDYLYFPLGGSRRGKLKTFRNVMIVFLVSGLWHGANMTFIVWGALHGLFQIAGNLTRGARDKVRAMLHIRKDSAINIAWETLFTFALVCFGWVFFRANTLSDAILALRKMLFALPKLPNEWLAMSYLQCAIALISVAALFTVSFLRARKDLVKRYNALSVFGQLTCVYLCTMIILIFGVYGPIYDASQFIYFQF